MLKSTFVHLKGISRKKELELWRQGVKTWEQYRSLTGEQLTIFDDQETSHALSESISALRSGDMDFFSRCLHPVDYFRVLLAFPEDTLFLDIETTGLSLYYDHITIVGWSIGENYGVYVRGNGDDKSLRDDLKKAKAIVTYNGTLFDLKFLRKEFSNLELPIIHLDLRFFAKRVGLSGGQKVIEKAIGIAREKTIEDMFGEAAPILWHEYRRGDNNALKKLIKYNHADIEGMKAILDFSVNEYYKLAGFPKDVQVLPSFSGKSSKLVWAKKESNVKDQYALGIKDFSGQNKPLVTYFDLESILPLHNFCVVGIDLVSSEERESGCCVLKGNKAETSRIKTDAEILEVALASKATVVSIDSPLSIPKGRTDFFDDDPERERFGITRLCERILKKRGINSYPCLIPSMQKLTQRGMKLAEKLRKQGFTVIESYPGAAQDIMCIPRKQSGLKYLTNGLAEFGIEGNYVNNIVTHDELDAITSAIVGQFFWVGMYEGLGDEDEGYLIIPDTNANTSAWLSRKIIGVSGEIAAGKTTIANYLSGRGFIASRYSMILADLLKEKGILPNRDTLQKLGAEVHRDKGQRWLGKRVVEKVDDKQFVVIDGIRFLEDISYLREVFGPAYFHIHVEASVEIRSKRMANKGDENLTLQETRKSITEHEILYLKEKSDLVVQNNSSKKKLYDKIDRII